MGPPGIEPGTHGSNRNRSCDRYGVTKFFYRSYQPHQQYQPHQAPQRDQRLCIWTTFKSLIYSHVAIYAELVFMRNEHDPRALKTPALWREPINGWMAILKAGNLSSGTLIKRSDHARRLARAFPEVPPQQLTAEQLLAWVSQKSWQPETRHSYYSSMRMFFAYVQGPSPNAATVLPKIRRTVPPQRPCPENVLADALAQAPERERLIIRGCIDGDGYAFPGQIDGHLSAHHASKITNQYLHPRGRSTP